MEISAKQIFNPTFDPNKYSLVCVRGEQKAYALELSHLPKEAVMHINGKPFPSLCPSSSKTVRCYDLLPNGNVDLTKKDNFLESDLEVIS